MRKNIERQKGVSIVELIVVMAVIVILTSITIISYTVFIRQAKKIKADTELSQVYNLIYAEAKNHGLEIGHNQNNIPSLFVSTSGSKIVLVFNVEGQDELSNDEIESAWNALIIELIDFVTKDVGKFSGVFELDPHEPAASKGERKISYILENNEDYRSRKDLIVESLDSAQTVIKFLKELETPSGYLVPAGRARPPEMLPDGYVEVEEVFIDLIFTWIEAADYVVGSDYEAKLKVLIEINGVLQDDEYEGLIVVEIINEPEYISLGYVTMLRAKVTLIEPGSLEEYNAIKDQEIEIVFTIKIVEGSIRKP